MNRKNRDDNPKDKDKDKDQKRSQASKKIIIEGITEEGEHFRPSDWAERISGSLSTFRNHRIFYSPLLKPTVQNEVKCMVLDKSLKQSNPALYDHILEFAKQNKLKICGEENNNNHDNNMNDKRGNNNGKDHGNDHDNDKKSKIDKDRNPENSIEDKKG